MATFTTTTSTTATRWDRKPFRVERWSGKRWEHVDGHNNKEAARLDAESLQAEVGVPYRVAWD